MVVVACAALHQLAKEEVEVSSRAVTVLVCDSAMAASKILSPELN